MGYDAFLLVSFGGPEGPDDVQPFLANVTRGRGVPPERLAEVAEHYRRFGGVSPINAQNRELLDALPAALKGAGIELPLYWGNRNWRPFLTDALARMREDGVERAVAFVTSPFGSYSSCRQYQDDIAAARAAVGAGAPAVDKLRHYHDHPGYVLPHADAVRAALARVPAAARIVFTAHSVPTAMDATSGPAATAGDSGPAATAGDSGPAGHRYTAQLRETAALVAAEAAPHLPWDLVWQSRSGPPHVPWLEPDVNDHLAALAADGVPAVVVSPIGFVSDHLEVVWDLDTEAAATAGRLGIGFARAATPGVDPRFVAMVAELVAERVRPGHPRAALGAVPTWDSCPANCCPAPRRG